jgi:Zn-dependent protease with chaperone function
MRGLLSFLNVAYAPFIAFLAFVQLALAITLMVAGTIGDFSTGVCVMFWFFGLGLFALFCWFCVPMYYLFTWHPEPEWKLDLKVSREEVPALYELMETVAKRSNLPVADEIRLSGFCDAAVYETKKGRQVLLVGALTVASFPKEIVGAIMAHELAHIAAGDTAMLRDMVYTVRMMIIQRIYYMTHPDGFLHPFVWLVILYQIVFEAVYAAASRRWEYDADQASKRQAGDADTAIGLLCVHVTPHIKGVSFDDLLKSLARTGSYTTAAFTEQVKTVRAAQKKDWKRALKLALNEGPGIFGDHSSLSSRLKALDVHPDDALDWALTPNGTPMSGEIRGWPALEKKLTVRVLVPYIDAIEAKKDAAQVIKAIT